LGDTHFAAMLAVIASSKYSSGVEVSNQAAQNRRVSFRRDGSLSQKPAFLFAQAKGQAYDCLGKIWR
jgi:hypothetical protein